MMVDQVLQALADPTRRRILDLLAQGELSAGILASHFPMISRPAVSQHLAVLREAGLVTERKAGRHRLYQLEVEPLRAFWDGWLSQYQHFWDDRLQVLKRLVEEELRDGDSD
jgi:DNA-binding transcriptional ArsR family regulator